MVDTTRARLVWETPYYPTYYFPVEDVRLDLLEADGGAHSPSRGDAQSFALVSGERRVPGAALRYPDSPIEELRDLVRLEWSALDAWFEEDEEVFVHPRSPYVRVDILPSSRHIRIAIDGVTLAESTSPRLLFETDLPVRYYLPKTHVHIELLGPSSTSHAARTRGPPSTGRRARRQAYPDIAWSYKAPFAESERIAGLVAFYDEKLDVFVDGVRQDRPRTKFS